MKHDQRPPQDGERNDGDRSLHRRAVLVAGTTGLGLAWLSRLQGCALGDPGPPASLPDLAASVGELRLGEEHRIFDEAGAAYRIDPAGHAVHRLDDVGVSEASFGELGHDSGELNHPIDGVVDADGTLLVLDRGNGRVQRLAPDGRPIATFAEPLHHPFDLVLHAGRIYVADTLAHRVVVFDAAGEVVQVLGSESQAPGPLNAPVGVLVAPNGEIHVLELGDASVQVFDPEGRPIRRYGGPGGPEGLQRPRSIALSPTGDVVISDPAAECLFVFTLEGAFLDRIELPDPRGRRRVPLRVSETRDGGLYVWVADA